MDRIPRYIRTYLYLTFYLYHYPETMNIYLNETHFSYVQDVRMYCLSYRCRKCGDSYGKGRGYCKDTSAYARAVYAGSVREVCTTRSRRYSNIWTTKTPESPNRCAVTRTVPRLTLMPGRLSSSSETTSSRAYRCVK